jgi:ATP-dependent Clp protease ATP-binding subunit ClpC
MFVNFTQPARQAVVLAQDEARELGHDWVGTEHLLLGVMREGEGIGARSLRALGIRIDDVRSRVVEILGREGAAPVGQIAFAPRAKKVLEFALREAQAMNHDFIGTEHLLLGLAREPEGVACQVVAELGADGERIRNAVIGELER